MPATYCFENPEMLDPAIIAKVIAISSEYRLSSQKPFSTNSLVVHPELKIHTLKCSVFIWLRSNGASGLSVCFIKLRHWSTSTLRAKCSVPQNCRLLKPCIWKFKYKRPFQ